MRKRHVVWIHLCVAAAVALAPGKASAQTQPTISNYENLTGFALETSDTAECNPDGTSTVHYSVTGVATGAYPGTFTESGTFTIGPQTSVGGTNSGGLNVGPLLSFEATFTIISGATTIRGTKSLATPPPGFENTGGPFNTGACAEFENATFNQITNASGEQAQALAYLTYRATIQTPTETFHDRGDSYVFVAEQNFRSSSIGAVRATGFTEFYLPPTSPPPAGEPTTVTLSPATAVNPVGTSHSVTATVTNAAGGPVQGATVIFSVQGASSSVEGQCTTNAAGQCDFTFQGPEFPDVQTITGCADANADGDVDPGEPCGEATKEWVFPVSTPGKVTGGGQIVHLMGAGKVNFGLTFTSDGTALKGECLVNDTVSNTRVDCIDVLAFVQAGNVATIYGNAEVNGTQTLYKIVVTDTGEGMALPDTFSILTASGYAAAGPVTQGNVQVHA